MFRSIEYLELWVERVTRILSMVRWCMCGSLFGSVLEGVEGVIRGWNRCM